MAKSSRILSIVTVIGVLAACLFGSIDFHAFHKGYYQSEYAKLHTAESIGISEEGLLAATDALLDYLKDKRKDISCVQIVRGEEREVFDERETAHMVDVKALYLNARSVVGGIILLALISFAVMIYFIKAKGYGKTALCQDLLWAFKQVLIGFALIVGFLLMSALIDFNSFWIAFHQLFFRNDLWLLDPSISIMINMFPEEFFFGMVIRIIVTFVAAFFGSSAVLYGIYRRMIKNNLKMTKDSDKISEERSDENEADFISQ